MKSSPNPPVESGVSITPSPMLLGRMALAESHVPTWDDAERQATLEAIDTRLDALAEHVPEAAEDRERIVRGARDLAQKFQVKPEFFDESMRSTVFFSLAQASEKGKEEAGRAQQNPQMSDNRTFINNATFLLTLSHADAYPDLVKLHRFQSGMSGETDSKADVEQIISKFEDKRLSAELAAYIEDNDILSDARKELGITKESETPPELHVLNIGKPSDAVYFAQLANGVTYKEQSEWAQGLAVRSKELGKMIPQGEAAGAAAAFTADAQGEHHMFFPMAAAELIMSDERGIALDSDIGAEAYRERIKATAVHEYVHTQKPINVGNGFGSSLEEYRAEWFSGGHGDYRDVKSFFRHMQILYGKDMGTMLDEVVAANRQGSDITIYEVIANDYGLDAVAEIAASQPDFYVQHVKSQFVHDMLQSLGGFNGIVERAASKSRVDREEASARLKRGINSLRTDMGDKGRDKDYDQFLGSYLGPVLHALNLEMQDIPYEVPAK